MSMDKNVRGFIDTVRNTASAVGGTVAEVTREGAKKLGAKKEAVKLGMDVLRLRSSIDELYMEIGKRSYAIHMAEEETSAEENQIQMDGMYDEITQKEAEIVQLNKQIELINGGLACSACGRVSPASYDYCPACGAKLEKPDFCTEEGCCCASESTCCCCDPAPEGCTEAEPCCEEEADGSEPAAEASAQD